MHTTISSWLRVFEGIWQEIESIYNASSVEYFAKKDASPVTQADYVSNQKLEEFLKESHIPIVSEEHRKSIRPGSIYWLIDPLDGTKDFIEHTGEFCIMVSLIKNGSPIFGIIYIPTERVVFSAEEGKGAYETDMSFHQKHILFRNDYSLASKTAIISRYHAMSQDAVILKSLGVKKTIICGSVGVKIARILKGRADIYLNSSSMTRKWDSAAAQIIMSEANGFLTDIQGQVLKYNNPYAFNENGLLAAHKTMQTDIQRKLRIL